MGDYVNLTLDDRSIRAEAGKTILWAALDNGIYIPHLCANKGEERPNAGCRLCFVEIEGHSRPVTSCTRVVEEGLVVKTRSERVDRLVKTAFELLLSDHDLRCRECPANRSCALQEIALKRGLKLRQKRFNRIPRSYEIDDSREDFCLDRSRCVLCGKCVFADRREAKAGALGFANRGIQRVLTTFDNRPLAESACTRCGLCVEACPVGALYFKKNTVDKRQNA